jgi:hypothetical protein
LNACHIVSLILIRNVPVKLKERLRYHKRKLKEGRSNLVKEEIEVRDDVSNS